MKKLSGKKLTGAISVLALALVMATIALVSPQFNALGYTSVNTSNPIRVTVNGQWVAFPDQQPVMVENRVLVPVGGVFNAMGFTTHWDPVTRMARLTRSDFVIVIPAGSNSFVANNVIITPDVPQRMINNRLMLPLGAITAAVGGTSVWDPVNRVAHITTPTTSPTPTPGVTPTPSPTPTAPPAATPVPLLQVAPRFEGIPAGFATGGNAYMQGIRYTDAIWSTGSTMNTSRHNLNRNYGNLTATIGRFDGSGAGSRTVRFFGDGRNLGAFTVVGSNFSPINVSIDVNNVSILTIEIDAPGSDGVTIVVGNATLHPPGPATASPTPSPTPTPSPVPLSSVAPRFEEAPVGFAAGRNAYMLGVRHTNAIFGGGWSNHNLGGRFTTLTATIGRFDGSGGEARNIRFIGDDNRVLATFTVQGTDFLPLNISVDVRSVSILRIEIDEPLANGATAVLTNIMIH